jgi:hypothetical protein
MTMTLHDVNEAVDKLLIELGLGPNSWRHSSAYIDYVALEFACFATKATVARIARGMQALCQAHGWEVWRVTGVHNSARVTLQKGNILTTGDARMPPGGRPHAAGRNRGGRR